MKYILAIIFAVTIGISWAQNTSEAQLANEYYGQGDYDKAKNIYDNLAKNYANIPLIHNNYFFLLMELDEYKVAEKYIKRLTKKFPNNLYYHLDLGLLYYNSGDLDKADKYFNELIREVTADGYRTRITAEYFVSKRLTPYGIKTFEEGRISIFIANSLSS
ncbi:MAG: tetratricopeptide repeat protein, partial [Bacteroidota bacterium]